jgi:RNA polymerase sigma-70 factor (ECF subfamily)
VPTDPWFDHLWDAYYRRLWVFVRSLLPPEEAEDAVQEIMLKLYAARAAVDPGRPLAPWVYRVARNHCIDLLRAGSVRAAAGGRSAGLDGLADGAPDPPAALERRGEQETVRRFLAGLPPDDRQLLFLRFFESLRVRQIADTLGRPEGTVKYRLHELKRRLRDYMEDSA